MMWDWCKIFTFDKGRVWWICWRRNSEFLQTKLVRSLWKMLLVKNIFVKKFLVPLISHKNCKSVFCSLVVFTWTHNESPVLKLITTGTIFGKLCLQPHSDYSVFAKATCGFNPELPNLKNGYKWNRTNNLCSYLEISLQL